MVYPLSVMQKFLFRVSFLVIFILNAYCSAQSVTLNYPENGFVTSQSSLELCWNVQANHFYEIEVSTLSNFSSIFYTANNLNTRKIIVSNLVSNSYYFWRVRSESPLISPWSNMNSFVCYTPAMLSNLNLWLKADTLVTLNNNSVLTWGDLSNNQYSLTQASAANQPTLTQTFCNDKRAIKFDGTDAFEIPNFNFGSSNTVFIVGKKNGGTTSSRYLGVYGNNMEIATDLTVLSNNTIANYSTISPSILSLVRTSSISKFFFNDSLLYSTNLNIPPLINGSLYLGRSLSNTSAGSLTGEIAEVILCPSQLSDSLISLTNRYLMDKYSEILTLGNDSIVYDNFCPITLNPGIGFSDFLWSTGDTTASINVNMSGDYWLRAKDYFGRYRYDTIHIQFPNLTQLNSQSICLGNQLTWNTGLVSPYLHLWQDNSSQNQIIISSAGQYYFTITDTYGCSFTSDTANIYIDNFSNENSLGNDTTLCGGNTLQLLNNTSTALNYLWSTGSVNDSIVVSNSGQYWVEVSNLNNCIFRDTINITISGVAPQAAFSAINGCIGAPVQFTDLSTSTFGDNIVLWEWNFGDNTLSNFQNNSHTYDSAGIYLVGLKVISQSGCGAVVNQIINVFKSPILSYTAFNLCNNKLTELNNTSNLFGGSQQSVLWEFGDGNSSNTNQAFHSYNLVGNYLLKLTIITVEGCIDSIQGNITIKPSPIANFEAANICLGNNTLFTDVSQNYFPWQTLIRKWEFPNNDTSSFFQPNYTFDSAGVNMVSLYIQSSNGCSDTIIKPITIYNNPVANFTYEKNCNGNTTIFTDSSICINCQIFSYNWTINNASVGNTALLNYVFNDTGAYSVNLTVSNNVGCSAIKDTVLNVNPTPVANFTINSNLESPPFYATFSNLSQFATTYLWEFGDGNFSQEFNPNYIYNDTGSFTIKLTALNDDDCESSATQILKLQRKKIDLEMYDLSVQLIDGYLESDMIIFNKSTKTITSFETIITNGLNIETKETLTGNIVPGELKSYKLNTKIKQGEGYNATDALCIEIIKVAEGIDIDLKNNKLCATIENNQFKIINIFPNPTYSSLLINFISPAQEEITLDIFDLVGHKMYSQVAISKIGFNQLNVPSETLAAGSYFCNVTYGGKSTSILFVKLNVE
jgi:PKD repeat protein